MKTKYFILVAILAFTSDLIFGQIMKVDSYGKIILRPYNISNSILITEDYDEPQIYPSVSGYGYLGTGTNYWWRVTTRNIWRTNEYYLSDSTVKENIKPLKNNIDKLMKVNGIQFDFGENAFKNEPLEKKRILIENGKNSYGFTAQNLMAIFPNMVKKDDDGLLYISTDGLLPVLVEAIKEQQKEIETLQTLAILHEEEIVAIKKKLEIIEGSSKLKGTALLENNTLKSSTAVLFQNIPNPFTIDTKIEYFVPEEVTKATIVIYDIQGNEVKQTEIEYKGSGNIIIPGATLYAGLYFYSLIADGQIIDTRRMILTK